MGDQTAQQLGVQLRQDAIRFGTAPGIHFAHLLPQFPTQFNGTITNDKFCMSRLGRLHLSWWRLPVRSRAPVSQEKGYPTDANELHCYQEGTHEETKLGHPASLCGNS